MKIRNTRIAQPVRYDYVENAAVVHWHAPWGLVVGLADHIMVDSDESDQNGAGWRQRLSKVPQITPGHNPLTMQVQ